VYEGGEVSMFYDPLIAKLCSYGKDRETAIKKMQKGLSEYFIEGITANISFLESIIRHPKYLSGDISTNFIGEEYPEGFNASKLTADITDKFIAVATFIYLDDAKRASLISGQIPGRGRLIGPRWVVNVESNDYAVFVSDRNGGYEIECNGNLYTVHSSYDLGGNLFQGTINNEPITFRVRYLDDGYRLTNSGMRSNVVVRSPRVAELSRYMPEVKNKDVTTNLIAPMAGKIVRLCVKKGDVVKAGDDLVVVEAMKMENLIKANHDTEITEIHFKDGDSVASGQEIMKFGS
jgi:propionyl-CoA carboxylase alpha chain